MDREAWRTAIHRVAKSQTRLSETTIALLISCVCVCVCVCVLVSQSYLDSVTPWTVVHQAPLSMRFSRQEYWTGLPFPPPGDLPNLGIKPGSPALQADSLQSETRGGQISKQRPRLPASWRAHCL